jgi:hypothetical protein
MRLVKTFDSLTEYQQSADLRYVDESLKISGFQNFNVSCHYHNLLKMLDFKWIS